MRRQRIKDLSLSCKQCYELRRQERWMMEKRNRTRERKHSLLCRDKMVFSLQNEFIRRVRNSHCWDSGFQCDKGWEQQIGGKKEFHFLFFRGRRSISGSAEEPDRGKNWETGGAEPEQVGEVNARKKGATPWDCCQKVFKLTSEGGSCRRKAET